MAYGESSSRVSDDVIDNTGFRIHHEPNSKEN